MDATVFIIMPHGYDSMQPADAISGASAFICENTYSTETGRLAREKRIRDSIVNRAVAIAHCDSIADAENKCRDCGIPEDKTLTLGTMRVWDDLHDAFKWHLKRYNPKSRSFYTESGYSDSDAERYNLGAETQRLKPETAIPF